MAASKAPKHDFAPAWLKIPASDNGRPKGYDSDRRSGNKRGDYYGPPGPPDYGYQLQKQRSLDQHYDGRYSGKHRHHSADEEFYSPPYPGVPYYNSYNGFEKYGSQYRSQPALFRPQGRDKYPPPPPPGRFGGQVNGMNGMYPPQYPYGDPYFEFFQPDPYYQAPFGGRPHTSGGGGGKRYHHTERDKDKYNKSDKADKKKEMDDDFPTLKGEGDKNDSKSGKPASGVWDKPLKVNTTQSSSESPQPSPDIIKEKPTQSSTNNSIYKALVPNKGVLNRKPSKDSLKNGPLPSGSGKPSTPTSTTPGPAFKVNGKQTVPVILTKEGTRQSPTPSTPPMDILNSQLVTQPRRLGDKKSNFLRQLKKDKSPEKKESDKNVPQVNGDANSHEQSQLMNGVDSMHLSPEEEKALSSSLEAEHRLLREMGWNEEDYEECEITEDERKEMERLQSELKQQRNCQQRRTLPKTLSPQHLPSFVPPADLNETLSSDSESDLD